MSGELKLRLMTYLAAVSEFSDGAVAEASRRYTFGNDGRNAEDRRFPPSVPDFREMTSSVEAQIRLASAPPKAEELKIKRPAYWPALQERIQNTIAHYRASYVEALNANPGLNYINHILAEHKAATGRSLNLPRVKAGAR
jgi:hypothetical protein